MCLAWGGVGGDGDEWMRGLGLDFTNPVGTGGVQGARLAVAHSLVAIGNCWWAIGGHFNSRPPGEWT